MKQRFEVWKVKASPVTHQSDRPWNECFGCGKNMYNKHVSYCIRDTTIGGIPNDTCYNKLCLEMAVLKML